MKRFAIAAGVAAVAGLVTTGVGYGLTAAAPSAGTRGLGPGAATVELDVQYSKFSTTRLVVHEGTLVRFVMHNADPIRHELIVGPQAVHDRHASGTEAAHPPVPGEVTVDPGQTAETVYRFDTAGTIVFACHLPGHYQYGMHGVVQVLPADQTTGGDAAR
jgi:uncharacterized cupredoxin-like copper-binding protein